MSIKEKLRRTLIVSISASVFLIAAGSFAGVTWAERDGTQSIEQSNTLTPSSTPCPPAGDLDLTFDGDGKVTTSISNALDIATSVAIQADGKIVAAGRSADSGSPSDFSLVRYNSDGTLDTTFDGDGKVTTSVLLGSQAEAVGIQADGKIVAAGYTVTGSSEAFAVVRYNTDGSLDTSFDGDGKLYTEVSPQSSRAHSIAFQANGRMIVAGTSYDGLSTTLNFAIVRYNVDGSLDTTFDGDGIAKTSIGGDDIAYTVAIQPNGRIVAGGLSYFGFVADYEFALVRYLPNGSLDPTFSGDGKVTTPIFSDGDYGRSLVIQPDGRIVLGGFTFNAAESRYEVALARYNATGSLDRSFSGDGKVTTSVLGTGTNNSHAYSIALQPDGKIVAAGSAFTGGGDDFALVRYDALGRLDTTFDGDGKLTTGFGGSDEAYAVAIQPDGKIVAAGQSDYDFALARYNSVPCRGPSVPFDYDGDERADISIFRTLEGSWSLNMTRDGGYGTPFGVASDRIAPADYDNDGKTDVAVYRPSTGVWYILNISTGVVSYHVFGVEEDLPTPADYDGDGKADISVYRPSLGTWYRQNSSDGSFSAVQFGISEDKPTLGDFDGDGKADVAVYRPSAGVWYHLRSSDGGFFGQQFGIATDKIAPADYDGDLRTDMAVYRPSSGTWYIRYMNGIGSRYTTYIFGVGEDVPVAADYDGDGKADISVFRPSNGTWYIANSGNPSFTIVPWGTSHDRPTPAAFRY